MTISKEKFVELVVLANGMTFHIDDVIKKIYAAEEAYDKDEEAQDKAFGRNQGNYITNLK